MKHHHDSDRVTAAELVDYALYWYAIVTFLLETASTPGAFSSNLSITSTSILAISFFVFVLLRNYLVMHAIDTAEHREMTTLDFIVGNGLVADRLERFVRFLIMLTVIVSPKGAFGWANIFINRIVALLSTALGALMSLFRLQEPHELSNKSIVHAVLPYYSGVLFILFVLFIFWDLINVASVIFRIRSGEILKDTDIAAGRVQDGSYRAFLRYCNVCRLKKETTEQGLLIFKEGFVDGRGASRVLEGKVFWLYCTSHKFFERIFGIVTSLSILLLSLTEVTQIVLVFTVGSIGFYAFHACQNERYFRAMWGHVRYPKSYLFGGTSPFA